MKTEDLDDWAAFLDREISALRGHSNPATAMLDTSYAELRAASDELRERSAQIERVVLEANHTHRRREALLQLVTDAVIETDAEGKVLEANESAGRLLNVRSEFLLGKALLLFVSETAWGTLREVTAAAVKGSGVVRQDLTLQPRDGPALQCSLSAVRVAGDMSEPARITWLIRDVAERTGDLRAWRAQRDSLGREVSQREAVVKDLDQSIGDRLAGIRKLSRRIMELQDFEGQKLARELRERFGQTLGAIKLNLEAIGKSHPDLRATALHKEALKLIDGALQRLREIYFELSPPLAQGIGLTGMIRQLLARVPDPEHLKTSFESDGLPLISPQVESAALWVAREAINNAVRHSGASALEVRIQREGSRLVMAIRDNGRGFNVPATRNLAERAGCFGLVGMEERVAILGGDIQVISAPRQGTEIRVMFPAAARE
jgi:PAS domain S-box-containing protein